MGGPRPLGAHLLSHFITAFMALKLKITNPVMHTELISMCERWR